MEERLTDRRKRREASGRTAGRRGKDRPRSPGRAPGAFDTPQSDHHAVQYGCRRAGVTPWRPNPLRHNAGTWLRREFGIEVARVILGHGRLETTEIDAEADREKALAAMGRVG